MKAQVSVETVIIYGVTILIIIGAIGAVFGLGMVDFNSFLPDGWFLGKGIYCEDYVIHNTGVVLELSNSLGYNLINVSIDFIDKEGSDALWQCDESIGNAKLINTFTSPPLIIKCNIQTPIGKKIEGKILMTYYPVGKTVPQKLIGSIRGLVSVGDIIDY